MEDDKTLLDYYTKNMTLHATVTVAIVFGLFSILGIISNMESWVTRIALTIGFGVLVMLGFYEIGRYKHYGDMAKEKARIFRAKDLAENKETMGIVRKWMYENAKYFFERAEFFFLLFMCYLLVFVWIGVLY